MRRPGRLLSLVLLPVLLSVASGCGDKLKKTNKVTGSWSGTSEDRKFNDLKDLGVALSDYFLQNKKGASRPEDLAPFLKDNPKLLDRLRAGDLVVLWGVSPSELRKKLGGERAYVIAYEKNAPTAGGFVLLGDALVQKVTAEEFKKLKLAQPDGK